MGAQVILSCVSKIDPHLGVSNRFLLCHFFFPHIDVLFCDVELAVKCAIPLKHCSLECFPFTMYIFVMILVFYFHYMEIVK